MSNNQAAIQLYATQMQEIKRRTEVIDFVMFGQGHSLYEQATIETICLQIRKILELIAFSSLVANKDLYANVHKTFETDWKAKKLLERLEKINPNFYPYPVVDTPSSLAGQPNEFLPAEPGYLTKAEFVEVYDHCGKVIHAVNPLGSQATFANARVLLPAWRQKIMSLLNLHQVRPIGIEKFWLISMQVEGTDEVHYCEFELVARHG